MTKKPKEPISKEPPKEIPKSPNKSILTKPLGLEGWSSLEPIILAALISEDPLLLVGRHGTAKSFLLERLAQALNMSFRFYNASLVNYDDLVGIPIPRDNEDSLRYISTPTAIWDAQVVFIDEISRCRPELQNKLFPIIHEKRVQGMDLEKLIYRWSAMNPAPTDEDDEEVVYQGAEPLDPALADRFGFILEVPTWGDLTESEKKTILLDQFLGRHEFPIAVPSLVKDGQRVFKALMSNAPSNLADYLITIAPLLEKIGHHLSTRRMTMLMRQILAIQSSRTVINKVLELGAPSWEDAVWLAIKHSLPNLAMGIKVDIPKLLACHRQAWEVCGLDKSDPWRQILSTPDPIDRLILACKLSDMIDITDMGGLVTSAISSAKTKAERVALSLIIYLKMKNSINIPAFVIETIAIEAQRAISPSNQTHKVYGNDLKACQEVAKICHTLGTTKKDLYCKNLLNSLLPSEFNIVNPETIQKTFYSLWDKFELK